MLIEPENLEYPSLTTEQILRTIDDNASSTALILLSAVQFYTGQYFDMQRITAHSHSKGISIGWDCAHAVGNVDLQLHDWNVDFAAWCSYKYLNSGPGGMAGLFVHEKHGHVDMQKANTDEGAFRPRLTGWWGADKETRFLMENGRISADVRTLVNLYSLHSPAWCSRISTVQPVCLGHECGACFTGDLQPDIHG